LDKTRLKIKIRKNGKEYWGDLCVVDTINGPSLPCDWLVFVTPKNKRPYVYLKGKPKGKIIGSLKNKIILR